MKKALLWGALILTLAAMIIVWGCGDGGSGSGTASVGTSKGALSLSLIDASSNYNAVYVTIGEIQVHPGGGDWITLLTPHVTVNLLDLRNGVRQELGIADLSPGHYTQLRLNIDKTPDSGLNKFDTIHPFANYVVDASGNIHDLKIPSGEQSGVKIVNEFDINENRTTEIVLDFDACRSVVEAGSSGKWILKPVIRIAELLDAAILEGIVYNSVIVDTVRYNIAGALVNAQYNAIDATGDEADRAVVEAATSTATDGSYALFVAPGRYGIVAYADGFAPLCVHSELLSGTVTIQDFPLTGGDLGGFNLTVEGLQNAQSHATLSFRQIVPSCAEPVEIKSVNVANNSQTLLDITAGNYVLVASSYGEETVYGEVSTYNSATLYNSLTITFGSPGSITAD